MEKIEGALGVPSFRVGVFQTQFDPPKFMAVQEYRSKNGIKTYIKMKIPKATLKSRESLFSYMKKYYRTRGEYTTAEVYANALKSNETKVMLAQQFNQRVFGDYSATIKRGAGSIPFDKLIKYVIPLAQGDDVEFMRSITA